MTLTFREIIGTCFAKDAILRKKKKKTFFLRKRTIHSIKIERIIERIYKWFKK